jgi:hypothetical protein
MQTDVETKPLYDWSSYEKDMNRYGRDPLGVEPYKIFDLPANTSKILKGGIKASSGKVGMRIIVKCGDLKDEKEVFSIDSLKVFELPI